MIPLPSDHDACIRYCIENKENLSPHELASVLVSVPGTLGNLLDIAIGLYPFPRDEEWHELLTQEIDKLVSEQLGEQAYSQDLNIVDYWKYLKTQL